MVVFLELSENMQNYEMVVTKKNKIVQQLLINSRSSGE